MRIGAILTAWRSTDASDNVLHDAHNAGLYTTQAWRILQMLEIELPCQVRLYSLQFGEDSSLGVQAQTKTLKPWIWVLDEA